MSSGCGTGRSTIRLRRMYPDHTIIGVDRSLVRLSKNGVYRQQSCDLVEHDDSNVFFVRAELCDFWRLCLDNPIGHIQKHFILYPNPYPKAKRFQNRWYAHPGFPLIRQIGGDEIVIRSNWKAYLDDFSTAIAIAEELEGIQPIYDSSKPMILDPKEDALTNFEKKFFDAGEIAYELRLKARKE